MLHDSSRMSHDSSRMLHDPSRMFPDIHLSRACDCESRTMSSKMLHDSTSRNNMNVKVESYMGSLRLVGSLKLQVSFAEYSLFYKALLHKRLIIVRSLLIIVAP